MVVTSVIHLINLAMPDVRLLKSVPNTPARFGTHIRTLFCEKPSEPLSVYDENSCGGDLVVRAVGKSTIQHLSRDEPVEVHCAKCHGYTLVLSHNNWDEAVMEWLRIVFASGLWMNLRIVGSDANRFLALANGEPNLRTFLPAEHPVAGTVSPLLFTKIWANDWLPSLAPVWPSYRFAVANLEGLQDFSGMMQWGVIAAILLKDLERVFQIGVKSAATLASSSSEPFHPQTRRYTNK